MATYYCKTQRTTRNGIKHPYKITVEMNSHGKIRSVKSDSPFNEVDIRPYMFLDLLAEIMPKWLFTGDVCVEFGHANINNPKYNNLNQPCLIVYNNRYGTKNYLINHIISSDWLVGINSINLSSMVLWWRENRENFFKKPSQKWEIEKIN